MAASAEFSAQIADFDGAVCLSVTGDLDLASTQQFLEAIAIAAAGRRRVVLDLSRVEFIDSSGVGAILRAHQLLAPTSSIVLRSPTPQARRVFQMTALDKLVSIED